jgi:hypothetical protein
MLFHLSSKKYFEAIPPPIFIKCFLYKEKYLEFLFVILNSCKTTEESHPTRWDWEKTIIKHALKYYQSEELIEPYYNPFEIVPYLRENIT